MTKHDLPKNLGSGKKAAAVDAFFKKFSDKFIWIGIALYVIVFCYLCFLKFYSFNYRDWDFACDLVVLWNSVHGRMLYFPFMEQILFGVHLNLIILLVIPIYAIFQHPLTLLFLQTIFLALPAYPLYLLARLRLNHAFALMVVLVYLFFPALGFINIFETHFDIYVIFFLFFALYYFEKDRFLPFLIFIFLALSCKENISAAILMFGFYALIRKKTKRWIFFPLLSGILWFVISVKLVIPYFIKENRLYPDRYIFTTYYQHLGKTMPEMFGTLIFHPLMVLKYAFMKRKLVYLFQLFLPTGFLVILSPVLLLMTIPLFLQYLLSIVGTHATIYFQYTAPLLPFIFASYIYAIKKLLDYKIIYRKRLLLLCGCLAVGVFSNFILGAPQTNFLAYKRKFVIDDYAKKKKEILKMIPKDASIITTFQFLSHLTNRKDLYTMHFVSGGYKMYTNEKYVPPQNLEYALIDFNESLMISSFYPPEASANIRSFLEEGKWGAMTAMDDIVLFKKNYSGGLELTAPTENPPIQNVVNGNADDQVMFLGYDVAQKEMDGDKYLHIVSYWKRLGSLKNHLGIFFQFFDSQGQPVFAKGHSLGYRVYGPDSWSEGQTIRENQYIYIPASIKNDVYEVRAGIYILENGFLLPVSGTAKIDAVGRIVLNDVTID